MNLLDEAGSSIRKLQIRALGRKRHRPQGHAWASSRQPQPSALPPEDRQRHRADVGQRCNLNVAYRSLRSAFGWLRHPLRYPAFSDHRLQTRIMYAKDWPVSCGHCGYLSDFRRPRDAKAPDCGVKRFGVDGRVRGPGHIAPSIGVVSHSAVAETAVRALIIEGRGTDVFADAPSSLRQGAGSSDAG